MIKFLLFIFLFYISAIAAEDYFQDRILFCLNANQDSIVVSYKNNIAVTGNEQLNKLLSEFEVKRLEQWLRIKNSQLAEAFQLEWVHSII